MFDKIQAALDMNATLEMTAQLAADSGISDEEIMRMSNSFPDWRSPYNYQTGDIVKYGYNADGEVQLYRVVTAHTSQDDWAPDAASSLFSKIGFLSDGTPIWTQPSGAHDAYNKGDIVKHNDKKWKSDIAANTYEPGVYGWTEI